MAKGQSNKKLVRETIAGKPVDEISVQVEQRFNLLLKIMSWIVGISFVLIIILPNFDFPYLNVLVKIIFFLGIFNLLLFAFLEIFGASLKKLFSKMK
jgi:hypothetical protein